MDDKLEQFFVTNKIKQILVYKTRAIIRVGQLFTPRILEYITTNIDGKIVLLNEDCIGQVEFEEIMKKKYGDIDHFIFSQPLIAVILKDKKMKKEEDWCVFQYIYRKYFYKSANAIECWAMNDENGKFIKTNNGERLDIISSMIQAKQEKEDDKEERLNKIVDNNSYCKKEVNEIIKKIAYIVNNNIHYDNKSKVYTLKYGKNRSDIIDYLNTIKKFINDI